MRSTSLGLLAPAALAAVVTAPLAAAQEEPPPPRVRLVVVELRDMAPHITVPATVASRNDSDIAAEASGRVTFVAEPGAMLREGEAVARLDDAEARLALDEARARVARLEVSLGQQSRDVERREELRQRGALSEAELDVTEAQRDMTGLELREARIAVSRAETNLARTIVAAPFPGVVAERFVEVGEFAAPGAQIARLVDTGALEARARAPVDVISYVAAGDALDVSTDARRVAAPVRTVIAAGDARTRTFELRLDLAEGGWVVGAPVRVRIPSGPAETSASAPRDALVLRSQGAFVVRVDAENVATRVPVAPGVGDGDWIALGDAVAPGDRLVVRGAENLRDGQTVDPLGDAGDDGEDGDDDAGDGEAAPEPS